MKDLLKLPLVIIISMVLAVNRFGDMGCYSMVGNWLVGTVSTSIIPKVNFDYLCNAQCEHKIISSLVSYAKSLCYYIVAIFQFIIRTVALIFPVLGLWQG